MKSLTIGCSNPKNPLGVRSTLKTIGILSLVMSDLFRSPDSYICGLKAEHGALNLQDQGLLNMKFLMCPNEFCETNSCSSEPTEIIVSHTETLDIDLCA